MDLVLSCLFCGVHLILCKSIFPSTPVCITYLRRITTYLYWLSGTLTNDLNETSFLAAVINTIGCVGSTFGFVVSAEDVDYNAQCAINLALFFISMPPLAWVVFKRVTETSHELRLSEEVEQHNVGQIQELPADADTQGEKSAVVAQRNLEET